jgi:signal transduction histidine kinase
MQYLLDKTDSLQLADVLAHGEFKPIEKQIPNFAITTDALWLRFTVNNQTAENHLKADITYPILNKVDFYYPLADGQYGVVQSGELRPFKKRSYNHQNFVFDLNVPAGATRTFFLRIQTKEPILVPTYIGTEREILTKLNKDDLFLALYLGVILVMFLYNIFIFFTTRDWSYFYYICYIATVGFTQICLLGFGYRYWWHDNTFITEQSVQWGGVLSGLGVLLFVKNFLHVRSKSRWANRLFWFFIAGYCLTLVICLLGQLSLAYAIIDMLALSVVVFILIFGLIRAIKYKERLARIFLLAWVVFIASIMIFVLKDVGIIPYNIFTSHILLIGSAVEVVLLSFALADKINTYKKEKEDSQAAALRISQENEKLVREQNIVLEERVAQRTEQLVKSNDDLNTALSSLKEAQSQLVEKEKMASLGQLTAGIAHEINNPINFVTSNIKPLKLDIEDIKTLLAKYEQLEKQPELQPAFREITAFKNEIDIGYIHEEITSLLKGIEDGAMRTAEIVKGLRTFSRLDESDVKFVDLHEGIDSTLVLLRNAIPSYVKVVRNYGELPKVECYAGKVNQVFMNIITNAISAIKKKGDEDNATLTITTRRENGFACISIKDSGTGMPQEVKEKIFDPFFTTKDVGEGTGLGLSIVFNIIEKHNGRIIVNTAPDEGAEFVIYLPLKITHLPN